MRCWVRPRSAIWAAISPTPIRNGKALTPSRLLAAVHEQVVRHGWTIGNIDATVVVQAPKLAPYITAMRDALAEALTLDIAKISVKAKTSEGMGYTGDGSGIAAYAVALLTPLT